MFRSLILDAVLSFLGMKLLINLKTIQTMLTENLYQCLQFASKIFNRAVKSQQKFFSWSSPWPPNKFHLCLFYRQEYHWVGWKTFSTLRSFFLKILKQTTQEVSISSAFSIYLTSGLKIIGYKMHHCIYFSSQIMPLVLQMLPSPGIKQGFQY